MKPIIVKIGGSTLGSHDTTLEDVVALWKKGLSVVLVHGGGKTITQWLERQGVPAKFVGGLRVTDAKSLGVVVAVLAGLVNKELVARIQALGGKALGLSGVDGGFIEARVANPELGFVGEVTRIDPKPLEAVIAAGYIPVIATVALSKSGSSNEAGTILNINADTVAGELAVVIRARRLVFLTDVAGVQDGAGKVIPRLASEEARSLMASGVVSGGMIPKLEACLKAVGAVDMAQIVDGRLPHALINTIEGEGAGTTIAGG
ncbi:MAG: acetylglutamate kinase [Chloroflexi bacterium]|nr:acetylglutamate kinase [Chloroflexota bacterium]